MVGFHCVLWELYRTGLSIALTIRSLDRYSLIRSPLIPLRGLQGLMQRFHLNFGTMIGFRKNGSIQNDFSNKV